MTNEQKKFLKVRLAEAYRLWRQRLPDRWASAHRKSEPATVRKARADIAKAEAVVRRWEKKIEQQYTVALGKLNQEHQRAQEALLFHAPEKALAAIEAFEKKMPAPK